MDSEFHYYITYFLALSSGLSNEEAYVIAYSSQYVDDNTIIYKVSCGEKTYKNYISQTLDITKPQRKLMRIYPVFHFIPGSQEEVFTKGLVRKDGKAHILMTIENNKNALFVLRESIRSRDLFWIGIALHAYADTFAHQNFAGCYDSVNGIRGIPERFIPNIGHADLGIRPDRANLIWEDSRLRSDFKTVDNKKRVLFASRMVYRELCKLTSKDPEDEDLLIGKIDEILGEPTKIIKSFDSRIPSYKKIIGDGFIPYDKEAWLKEALDFKLPSLISKSINSFLGKIGNVFPLTIPVYAKDRFYDSRWFKFQEAVKKHQKTVLELLKGTFSLIEIEKL